jgi:hypothetical protein
VKLFNAASLQHQLNAGKNKIEDAYAILVPVKKHAMAMEDFLDPF